LPSQFQSSALFTRIELQYPQLFFPGGRTQSQHLGSDLAWFRVYGGATGAGLASYQGGLWYKNGTEWKRFGSLDQVDQQFCTASCLTSDKATGGFAGNIVLGAPTASGITLSLLTNEQSGSATVEYGEQSSSVLAESAAVAIVAGEPVQIVLGGLKADSAYRYRVVFRPQGSATAIAGKESTFHTARAAGKTFTFTVQSDSHMDENSVVRMYHRTLANVLAGQPDFHVDLGDTFMTEKHYNPLSPTSPPANSLQQVTDRYLYERNNFSLVSASVPLFLANGNHEGEAGWLNTGGSNNLANCHTWI
jgi:hypothetical protein